VSASDADDGPLPAGDFATWLGDVRKAIRGERTSDVPCDGCTACCTSSQFVHIDPDEAETLARVPRALLFPAPGGPKGHVLMGYDEHGRCPMLVDGRCSIYAHRPRTCRTYDCRVFPAAGVQPEEDGKALIARRAARWTFDHPTDEDRVLHEAVAAAAAYVRARPDVLPEGASSPDATRLAVLAVEIHDAFVSRDGDRLERVEPAVDVIRAVVARGRGR
jgi:Fe-S-cluster containining protein